MRKRFGAFNSLRAATAMSVRFGGNCKSDRVRSISSPEHFNTAVNYYLVEDVFSNLLLVISPGVFDFFQELITPFVD